MQRPSVGSDSVVRHVNVMVVDFMSVRLFKNGGGVASSNLLAVQYCTAAENLFIFSRKMLGSGSAVLHRFMS